MRVGHRGIVRLVLNNGYADFNEQDSIAFASNPAFDASTMEVWGALLNGGQLFVIEHTTLIDPARFSAALRHGNVSVLFLTTALFNQYVQLIPEAAHRLAAVALGRRTCGPGEFPGIAGTGARPAPAERLRPDRNHHLRHGLRSTGAG